MVLFIIQEVHKDLDLYKILFKTCQTTAFKELRKKLFELVKLQIHKLCPQLFHIIHKEGIMRYTCLPITLCINSHYILSPIMYMNKDKNKNWLRIKV